MNLITRPHLVHRAIDDRRLNALLGEQLVQEIGVVARRHKHDRALKGVAGSWWPLGGMETCRQCKPRSRHSNCHTVCISSRPLHATKPSHVATRHANRLQQLG